jgi:hypothetical protein
MSSRPLVSDDDVYLSKLLEGYAAYDVMLVEDAEETDETRLMSVYSGERMCVCVYIYI